ncbi:hypothetical protein NWFMUON74_09840 [Nocardia wallacei]|uniref:Uncharacterized protein n=1 Tax=Nocardia wallacei TaxID=480035 RepID=A0A7G1KDB9_9NOCA|nr:hypothetical protein NWFMUON74_09840 [Nocardia wallacei]
MLIHEQARLIECVSPTVHFAGTDPTQLVEATNLLTTPLAPDVCAGVARLVERDHRYQPERSPMTRPPGNRAR